MTLDKAFSLDHQQIVDYMNSFPPTLEAAFTTPRPNQNIVLYEGALEISHESTKLQGIGTVEYRWIPYPCIKFEFELTKELSGSVFVLATSHDRSILLTLSNLQISVNGRIEDYSLGGEHKDTISGSVTESVEQNKTQLSETRKTEDLSHVIFHVSNFHDIIGTEITLLKKPSGELRTNQNRIVLEAQNWKITLDQLETAKDNIQSLKNQRGFAITHVGRLEKLDNQKFSRDQADNFLTIFSDFLSFSRGFRVPVILFIGYDTNSNTVWEYWNLSGGHLWKGVNSWCPTQKAGELAEVLPGFLDWWQEWDESERIALYWYFEANSSSEIHQKIILTQVALELISWVILVEKEKIVSPNGFDKLPASDKLRILLSKFKIPLSLPPNVAPQSSSLTSSFMPTRTILQDLVNLASEKDNKWIDGLHAFTEMRNGIVHPKKTKREKIYNSSFQAKYEASDLGLWYLELVLLAIFNYGKTYDNRLIKPRQNGETELVPWS